MAAPTELEVKGRKVKVTNLDKILFPKTGFTKGQLIDYYIRIAPWLLPHLRGRPLTFKRFPDGVTGEHFYEKNAPSFTPAWVKTAKVWRTSGESQINYVLINDLPTLVWCANLANIELHTLLAKAPRVERPTSIVFDLDPGAPSGVLDCAKVALWLKEIFESFNLQSFVKSSGSKGLHFYVPLNTAADYDVTQPIAQAIAKTLQRRHPDCVVAQMAKNLRKGKVFIDWSQNSPHKTTVCVYSVRAKKDEPFISMPLDWEELARGLKSKQVKIFEARPEDAIRRCEEGGDLFQPVLTLKQKLPAALKKIS